MENAFDPSQYWERRLQDNPGVTGVGYTSLGTGYNEWLYRMRKKVFLRLVASQQFAWEGASVLDVGSGTGFYIQRWKEVGVRKIVGSDLTAIATGRLRQLFPNEEFVQMDIGAEIPKAWIRLFDAVSAFDIFFHIVDDQRYQKALQNVSSALRPGGLFFFSDILPHGPAKRSIHMVSRSLPEVERYLRAASFEIINRVPMFVLLNQPLDTTSKIHPLLWQAFVHTVRLCPPFGYVAGAVLYPLESILTRYCRESPTTEILVCRKL